MADAKPEAVFSVTAKDCEPCTVDTPHWFDAHMPCWCCTSDKPEQRHEMMWNQECEVYFHRSCIVKRANDTVRE